MISRYRCGLIYLWGARSRPESVTCGDRQWRGVADPAHLTAAATAFLGDPDSPD